MPNHYRTRNDKNDYVRRDGIQPQPYSFEQKNEEKTKYCANKCPSPEEKPVEPVRYRSLAIPIVVKAPPLSYPKPHGVLLFDNHHYNTLVTIVY